MTSAGDIPLWLIAGCVKGPEAEPQAVKLGSELLGCLTYGSFLI